MWKSLTFMAYVWAVTKFDTPAKSQESHVVITAGKFNPHFNVTNVNRIGRQLPQIRWQPLVSPSENFSDGTIRPSAAVPPSMFARS